MHEHSVTGCVEVLGGFGILFCALGQIVTICLISCLKCFRLWAATLYSHLSCRLTSFFAGHLNELIICSALRFRLWTIVSARVHRIVLPHLWLDISTDDKHMFSCCFSDLDTKNCKSYNSSILLLLEAGDDFTSDHHSTYFLQIDFGQLRAQLVRRIDLNGRDGRLRRHNPQEAKITQQLERPTAGDMPQELRGQIGTRVGLVRSDLTKQLQGRIGYIYYINVSEGWPDPALIKDN